jgi:hypothetical protein
MNADGIEAVLDGKAPESEEQMLRIVRDTGLSAVGLFAITDDTSGERLGLAGSGTFVSVSGLHYILTARHVWEERLKQARKLGITIRTRLDHCFPIDIKTICEFGPPSSRHWSEIGPDIVLLRIPDVHVGSIEAAGRVFYNLSVPEMQMPHRNRVIISMLIGAPGSMGKFSSRHASIQMRGSEATIQNGFEKDGFDYVDALVNVSNLPGDQSLRGVSGGGLWKVALYESSQGESIETAATLQGVAFWEFPVRSGHRVVRCHGTESIKRAVACVDSGCQIH